MAQGLHLSPRLAMQQVLAPQLQQSLALLQAPVLELQALVEQELSQNPVLEEVPAAEIEQRERNERDGPQLTDPSDPQEPPSDVKFDPATEKNSDKPVDDLQAEFDRLLQMDQEWRDVFSQTNVPQRAREDDEEKRQFMFDSLVAGTSLQENLLEQVRFADLDDQSLKIAELIVGNIDERGYLQSTVDELALSTSVPAEKILEVLKVVQTFHPPGVAARDLRECLLLQLERAGRQGSLEYRIVDRQMDALGKRRFPDLARSLGVSIDEIKGAVERISNLEPRPGRTFLSDEQHYVIAEVFVKRVGDDFTVNVNDDAVPHLRISNTYKDLMAQPDSTSEVRDYIRDKIRAGKFLIKSLRQRQQTLLNIAKEIVQRQREFMDKGVAHLRPMTMAQVAEVVGVHETTVSRAVSAKYMETPQGVFEMKYFFTSGLPTSGGNGAISNESVKNALNELVLHEDKAKPVSDEDLVKLLGTKGIKIARRTVAKYRAELNILPSHLRRAY